MIRTKLTVEPKPPTAAVKIGFWVDEELWNQVNEFAYQRRTNRSAVMRAAIIAYMATPLARATNAP